MPQKLHIIQSTENFYDGNSNIKKCTRKVI